MPEQRLTVQQVADLYQIDPATVLGHIRTGRWPCLKLGPRTHRFTAEHLARIEAMAEHKPPIERRKRTKHSYP